MKIYAAYFILILASFGFHRQLASSRLRNLLPYTFAFWCALMTVFLWNFSEPAWPFDDFKAYYNAAQDIFRDTSRLYDQVEKGFVNIPILALFFVPFTWISIERAEFLMTFAGALAIGLTCVWWSKKAQMDIARRLLWVGVIASSGPIMNSMKEGNTTHFLLPILLAVVLLLRNEADWKAGLLLGACAVLKPFLAILGLYLIVTRRWRAAAGYVISVAILTGISLLLFGIDLHRQWYEMCVLPFLGKPVGAFNVQSLDSFLARMLLDADAWSWKPVEPFGVYSMVRTAFVLITTAAGLWWFSTSKQKPVEVTFSVALCLALILSPISWTHYYLLLLLPFGFALAGDFKPATRTGYWIFLISCLAVSLPVIPGAAFFKTENPILHFTARLFISHYFLGAILLMIALIRVPRSQALLNSQSSLRQE